MAEFQLPPTKIKRQYKCNSCQHTTVNPRIHLRHLNEIHGQKVRIVECPFCVYACQYRQKLNRHLRLVHNYIVTSKGSIDDLHTQNQYFYQQQQQQQQQQQLIQSTLQSLSPFLNADMNALLSQLIPVQGNQEDEPVDLSFPQEIKQIIRLIRG